MYPIQKPVHGSFPGLQTKTWFEPEEFPRTKKLVHAYDRISEEGDRVRNLGAHVLQIGPLAEGVWSVLHIHVRSKSTGAERLFCPMTSKFVAEFPGWGENGMAYISSVAGGTHIRAHCGASNTRLRCRLGLGVPPRSSVRVGDETRDWTERGVLVFDDSIDHEVWNRGMETSQVLSLDLWHLDFTAVERKALVRLSYIRKEERRLCGKSLQGSDRLAHDTGNIISST